MLAMESLRSSTVIASLFTIATGRPDSFVEARGIVIVADVLGSSTVITIMEPDGAGPCPLSGFPPGAAIWSDEKPGIAAPRTINRISMNIKSFFLILFTS
jgi:hypothetical protein